MQACKKLHDMYQVSLKLRYDIELHINGMVDKEDSKTPKAQRLSRLYDLRLGWKDLNWKNMKEVDLGTYFMPNRQPEFAAGVVAISSEDSLKVIWLPSAEGNGRMVEHHSRSPHIPIGDFTIDPTQDLLVLLNDHMLVSLYVHSYSCSSSSQKERHGSSAFEDTIDERRSSTCSTPHLDIQDI